VLKQLAKSERTVLALMAMSTVGIFASDLFTPLGIAIHLLYVIPLLMTPRLPSRTAPIVYAVVCTALSFVGAYYSPPGPIWIAYNNRLLAIPVFGITALLVMQHKRLEEERDRFFTLSLDLFCIAGIDGYFKRLNPAWTRTLGYTEEELLAKPWLHFIHPDDRDPTIKAAQKQTVGKSIFAFENRYRCKDGSYKWLSWTATPVTDQGVIYATARDITERKRREEQVQLVMDAAPIGMVMVNRDGRMLLVNKQFEKLFGYESGELIGQPVELLIPERFRKKHPGHREGFFAAPSPRMMGTGRDLFGLRKDGREFPVEIGLNPIKGPEGPVVIESLIDITERKRAEEDLLKARQAADNANQAKSEFLSRMSHELRTPLNAILGFGQLLELDALSPDQQQSVRHILKGGQHLLTLINEVLDIARIEAGRMTFSLEPVPIAAVIRDAVDLVRPQAAARNIQLILPSAQEEPVYVRADRQRLKQVLLNLLSNGVKYNREGGTLTISCQAVPEARYRMTITDTGGGIPPALLSRLFTPFDRLGANSSTEGTGLGLVLSRGLITAMGGTVSVDSVVGQGTSASVELLLSEPPAARTTAVSDKVQVTTPVSGGAFTVLYIEDNLSNYQLIERLVERRPGVRLLSAMQGKLGVELAASHRPDLILLDLNLPDIPGDEVLLRLRERPETAAIPVIMLSADAMQKQIDKLLAAGAQGYLTKPIEVASFYALLDELMAKKGG
jgi:PAS domain S-box-containing protein